MAKFYNALDENLIEFIQQQNIFFTGTAAQMGHVNVSPKGMDTFRCLNPHQVAYLDLTGSGNETAAHLAENGRLTIMFCSFGEKPLILRLYGKGRSVLPRHEDWQEYHRFFTSMPGERQIIVLDVEFVQTSCGSGVPLYELKEERSTLQDWAIKKGETGLQDYWRQKNQVSLDGLPTYLLED